MSAPQMGGSASTLPPASTQVTCRAAVTHPSCCQSLYRANVRGTSATNSESTHGSRRPRGEGAPIDAVDTYHEVSPAPGPQIREPGAGGFACQARGVPLPAAGGATG